MPDGVGFDAVVVSCEHAGQRVPPALRSRFATAAARRALSSHRGFDPGALPVARLLARQLGVPVLRCMTSRLVVEVNRSTTHPRIFSEFTRGLDAPMRARLLADIYHPHRRDVDAAVRTHTRHGARVLHVGVHSFAPRFRGETRQADLALLYDPARPLERGLCDAWIRALRARTSLRIRRNYPYRGAADGLTTSLRQAFPARQYLGIEIEINQRILRGRPPEGRQLGQWLADALNQRQPA